MVINKLTTFVFILISFAGPAFAQSQDRDNPTPLSSDTIKGTGIGKKVEYFYSFTAGPGELRIAIDLKAKAGATNADVEVFDADANKILFQYPNATTQSERAVKRTALSSKQPLVLRLAFDPSAGDYLVKLSGTVDLPSASGGSANSSDPSTSSSSTDSSTTTEGTTSTTPEKVSNVDFGMNILQAVGTKFGLPTSGLLHIVMKDGTTQDVDLSKVKSASLKKQ